MEKNETKMVSTWHMLVVVLITGLLVYVATVLTVTRTLMDHPEYMSDWSKVDYSYSGEFKKLNKVMGIVEKDYLNEYDIEKLEEGAIRGLLDALDDPYTSYFDKAETASFLTETEGNYEGVGMYVGMDTKKSTAVVLQPIEGSPAQEAGIEPGDYILEIEGESALEELS